MKRRPVDESGRKATSSGIAIAKRVRVEAGPAEKIVSETDDQIKRLLDVQTSTDVNIGSLEKRFKSFTQPAVYKETHKISGESSLDRYCMHVDNEDLIQGLRDRALTDDEINLWLHVNYDKDGPSKKSGFHVSKEVLSHRLNEIEKKISVYEERLKKDKAFAAAQPVSRLKLELEFSLNQGRSEKNKLAALVMKPRPELNEDQSCDVKELADSISKRRPPFSDYGNPYPNPWVPVIEKVPPLAGFVGPKMKDPDLYVSDDLIFKNRISVEEIKEMPKFSDYSPGLPNAILYVKNLGSTVRQEHLEHLFNRFHIPGDSPITCKLMTGKMRGQAFVTCADAETASRCLHTLNGYMLRGRPIIISYSQPKEGVCGSQANSMSSNDAS